MALSNIYGIDENSMAESIASDALGSPSSSAGIDQSAKSKGNGDDPGDVEVIHDKSDSRAKSKDNH